MRRAGNAQSSRHPRRVVGGAELAVEVLQVNFHPLELETELCGDRAELAQSCKQDHTELANTSNCINQTTRTALLAKRPADQTECPNRNFG